MKLCLAGGEEMIHHSVLINSKCKYWLSTFAQSEKLEKVIPDISKVCEFFILDSGAFTYQKRSQKKRMNYHDYIERYIDFIIRHESFIDEYIEFDIENLVGLTQVESWRDYMTKRIGRPPIVVWHPCRGLPYFEFMIKHYPYVAIARTKKEDAPYFVNMANKKNVKIHGLAMTSLAIMTKNNFSSVDSTSWIKESYYGLKKGIANEEYNIATLTRKNGKVTNYTNKLFLSSQHWVK